MKKLSIFFLLLFATITLPIIAEDKEEPSNHSQLRAEPSKKGPRTSVITSWIDCSYIDGLLYFNPSEDMGDLDVAISNNSTGATMYYVVDSDELTISVVLPNGSYYVGCTSQQGIYYEGTLTIQ